MDLQKLAQLAKSNPAAAKAFLNKKDTSQTPRKIEKEDKVFTERQLQTIVTALVQKEVARIPTPKDGKTPSKEEITNIIKPLMPVIRQPKDGKDAEWTPEVVDKIANKVLKQVAVTPDLTEAILKVFNEEKITADAIPGFKELKERVEKLAKNQKFIGQGKGIAAGYTDTDVRRVLAADGYTPGGGGSVSDEAYGGTWDGVTDEAPSKNAVYDKIQTLSGGHDPVTVTDSPEINFTLTGQDITASLVAGSIDESKLDASVNASLDLANSASQPGHTHTHADITDYDTELAGKTNTTAFTPTADYHPATKKYVDDNAGGVDDAAYDATTWNGVTGTAPSKNAVRDKIEALDAAKANASHTHATTDITSGTFADARIAESNVTQYQAALTITESQISDLGSYQPLDAQLTSLAGLVPGVEGRIVESDGLGGFAMVSAATFISDNNILDTADIGASVQAHSAVLDATTASFTTADETKLDGIEAGAEVNAVDSVNTQTGAVVLDADDIDDTSTAHKFVTAADLTTLSNTSGTNTGDEPDANTTTKGIVELATTAETDTGTDATRSVTPDALAGSYAGTKSVQMVCFDFGTDVATGDGAYYFRVPSALNGMNIVDVHAEVITSGTTGTTDIQLHNVTDAVDILSTKITIDSGETGSDTAATAPVISTSNDDLATNDIIRVDVDAVSTTAPQGLIVTFECRLP